MVLRLLLVLAVLLAAGRAEAQPFLYSLRNTPVCPASGPCPGPRLLVTNVRTGEIVNPDDPELFPGEQGVTTALTIGADGRRAYISVDPFYRGSAAPPSVLIVSLATYRPVGSIAVTVAPWFMVPSPDGRLLYGSSPQDNLVMVFDLASNQLTRSLRVEHAFSMGITADGATLAVVQPRPSRVSLIDTVSGTERLAVNVPNFPQRLAMSADGRQVYVATYGMDDLMSVGRVVTIDTGTGAAETRTIGDLPVGKFLPMPDGAKVYATFIFGGMWGVMKPPPNLTVFDDAVAPSGEMVPSADWSHVFIEGTDGVLVVNTTTDTVEATPRAPAASRRRRPAAASS
jgi:DNA-binding beta-propeller fold protein YncE